MEKTINGDIFIIPNEHFQVAEMLPVSKKTTKMRLSELAGIELTDDDEIVEVWIVLYDSNGEGLCDNLSCEFNGLKKAIGIDYDRFKDYDSEEGRIYGYFSKFLPLRVLKGLKEGDSFTLDCPRYEAKIELTARQLKYKYKFAGPFEEALHY